MTLRWTFPLLILSMTGLPGGTATAQQLDTGPPPLTAPWTLEPGTPHPDFVLPRIDNGQPLRLSDYRGRRVLLIHFASW